MKLKGEKELAIEGLYDRMDNELYDIEVAQNLNIGKLDVTDYDNFLDNMYDASLDSVIYYRVTSVIYKMDLSLDSALALSKLSDDKKLLRSLCGIVKNHINKVNIHSDKELEKFLNLIIAGILIK